jgi:hypothetical protein
VANGSKLFILPGLILLGFETCDTFVTCAYVQFQFFALNFDLAPFLLQRFDARCSCGELRLQVGPFQGQRINLGLDLPDLLLSILENEQLFQFRMHERSTY